MKKRCIVLLHREPVPKTKLTFGQRLSDKISKVGGSWGFLIFLSAFLATWMMLNVAGFFIWHWDPYPFILLNLCLSCLATYQAPIILMAQNRSAERDRHQAERDYAVNRKAEREVEKMQKDLDEIKQLVKHQQRKSK
ncbi:hypothetical protein CEE44_03760 [Candidatus Woesearchaeota archaeon B3_Woes]|nr:MAG: hypothetical protein CEE44_03760 [Candidatus Woesearchaeota archaeon B3_Woes]